MAESRIFRISDKAYGVYSIINGSAKIKTYIIKKNRFVLTDNFKPIFFKNKLIIESTTPMGDRFVTFKYEIVGVSGEMFYFGVFKKHEVIEYNKKTKSVIKRFFNYPLILKGVRKLDNHIMLFSEFVLDDHSKSNCRDKYFILKTHEWKDYKCFGKSKNLMMGFDFPKIFLFKGGKNGGIYFPKAGEMRIYNTSSLELTKTFKVLSDHKILGKNPGKSEHIHEYKDSFCLIKILDDRILIFKIDSGKWELAQEIKGKYKSTVLLDAYIILANGDKIDKKKLDF